MVLPCNAAEAFSALCCCSVMSMVRRLMRRRFCGVDPSHISKNVGNSMRALTEPATQEAADTSGPSRAWPPRRPADAAAVAQSPALSQAPALATSVGSAQSLSSSDAQSRVDPQAAEGLAPCLGRQWPMPLPDPSLDTRPSPPPLQPTLRGSRARRGRPGPARPERRPGEGPLGEGAQAVSAHGCSRARAPQRASAEVA